jgi:hypothetical protein
MNRRTFINRLTSLLVGITGLTILHQQSMDATTFDRVLPRDANGNLIPEKYIYLIMVDILDTETGRTKSQLVGTTTDSTNIYSIVKKDVNARLKSLTVGMDKESIIQNRLEEWHYGEMYVEDYIKKHLKCLDEVILYYRTYGYNVSASPMFLYQVTNFSFLEGTHEVIYPSLKNQSELINSVAKRFNNFFSV